MEMDNRHIDRSGRIGQHFAVLGLLGGLALLVVTLVLERSRQDLCRPARRAEWTVAGSGDEKKAAVAEGISCKESNGLFVFRKRPRAVERLRSGATVAAGDLLQIGYRAPAATHGVIVSVDGRGVVTLHFPVRVGATTALEPFGQQLLPYAFELDGAPTCERILFVTGSGPIDVSAVLAAGRATASRVCRRPELPRGLRVSAELLLKKQARR